MTDESSEPKRVSQQVNKPLAPEDDIGPFYKILAGILTVAAVILLIVHETSKRDNTWTDVAMFSIIVIFVLALIRPKGFDMLVKTIADKLPFLKYSKE